MTASRNERLVHAGMRLKAARLAGGLSVHGVLSQAVALRVHLPERVPGGGEYAAFEEGHVPEWLSDATVLGIADSMGVRGPMAEILAGKCDDEVKAAQPLGLHDFLDIADEQQRQIMRLRVTWEQVLDLLDRVVSAVDPPERDDSDLG